MKPLLIDLFCGLGGWSEAFLAEGWDAIGFDNERHDYGNGGYPGQLVLQDVCTIHGAQLVDADCIVASSPCQEFSYRAMPWKRAKALGPPVLGINLFWQAFRIQHEIYEACGRYVPLVAENVRGAQPWVGRAVYNYGSFYLWGDIPVLMPRPVRGSQKFNPDGTNHGTGSWFKIADSKNRGASESLKVPGLDFSGYGKLGYKAKGFNVTAAQRYREGLKVPSADGGRRTDPGKGARFTTRDCGVEGIKQHGSGAEWFDTGIAKHSSRSDSRKAASAQIAKIPQPLAQHIARIYKPEALA